MYCTTEKADVKFQTVTHYHKIVSNGALSTEIGFSVSVALNLMQHLFLACLMNRLWLFLCLLIVHGRQTATNRHAQELRRSESVILASSKPVSSHLSAHPQQSGQKLTVTALKKLDQTADKLLPEIHSSLNPLKTSRQAEIWLDVTSEVTLLI